MGKKLDDIYLEKKEVSLYVINCSLGTLKYVGTEEQAIFFNNMIHKTFDNYDDKERQEFTEKAIHWSHKKWRDKKICTPEQKTPRRNMPRK
jgi:hypothetical protein